MEFSNYLFTIVVVFLIGVQENNAEKVEQIQTLDEKSNPLENLILNENGIGDVSGNGGQTKESEDTSSRVKRQFYYDPYYYPYPRPVPFPVPIVVGGFGIGRFGGFPGRGFGRGFGGRGFGFGGRGFGGRGFGGRGFGGRGFGGRGFGGRGFGGFGGRRG